jgi:N-acetyl-anhydromuramyl-L-alanine amidase AmpD
LIDGRVTQMVHEKDIALHTGNPHCNRRSIGIEREAFPGQPGTLTDAMYRSSAALTRYLCPKYDIPKDREHIIGHNRVPDPKNPERFGGVDGRTDPGLYWNWDYFIALVTHRDDKLPAGQGYIPG